MRQDVGTLAQSTAHQRRDSVPATRFAYGGAVGVVLADWYGQDVQQARLSWKFKLYYRLRPAIPIPLRQFMQRYRGNRSPVPENWYLPLQFFDDFEAACRSAPDTKVIHPWPDGHQMSVVLTHDVETQSGVDCVSRLAAVEEEYGLRSAWNFVPNRYRIDTGLLVDLKERGHEIGVHGYNHDGRLFESRRTFRARAKAINRAITTFGGTGFRAPMVHRNLEWMQELQIDHDSSCFDIDPFQAMPGGVGGVWPFIAGNFVELPYTLPQDHTLLISLRERTPRIWFEKLRFLKTLSGMALLITHPDYLDVPERLNVYRQLLERVVEMSNTWKVLPSDVATWWRLRDQLTIDGVGDSARISGTSADRARLFSCGDLLSNRSTQEAAAL